jgi:hypothetical protein
MARRHWLGVLTGTGVVVGNIVVPNDFSVGLIPIGLVTVGVSAFDWLREGQRHFNQNGGLDKETGIRFAQGCDECRRYAGDFAKAFRLIGWNGVVGVSLDEQPGISGVRIVVKSPASPSRTAKAIVAGMTAAKIKFDWLPNVDMADNHTFVWVYPKEV